MSIQRVCVFCGSRPGRDPVFHQEARRLGERLAAKRYTLVYGGTRVGLMGILADTALQQGGEVIGVLPRGLFSREVPHDRLNDLRIVGSMHERKALMSELADAFLALPGGLGTLEELFEAWTWSVLGIHHKPLALLNIAGFFDPLIDFLDRASEAGFVSATQRSRLLVASTSEEALERLADAAAARPPYPLRPTSLTLEDA